MYRHTSSPYTNTYYVCSYYRNEFFAHPFLSGVSKRRIYCVPTGEEYEVAISEDTKYVGVLGAFVYARACACGVYMCACGVDMFIVLCNM